jgi:hypothetical protein
MKGVIRLPFINNALERIVQSKPKRLKAPLQRMLLC